MDRERCFWQREQNVQRPRGHLTKNLSVGEDALVRKQQRSWDPQGPPLMWGSFEGCGFEVRTNSL
jgi:hypothetical protein